MQVGDRIRFISENIEGIVFQIVSDTHVWIKSKGGVVIQVAKSDIILVDGSTEITPLAASENFLDRLHGLADVANTLAECQNNNHFTAAQANDKVGQIEQALYAISNNLEIQKRRQSAQYAATKVLAESDNLDDSIPNILKAICEGLGWQWSAMWTINADIEILRCGGIWHNLPRAEEFISITEQITFAKGVGMPGRVWETGKPLWIFDVQTDLNFYRRFIAQKVGLHGAFCFPIHTSHGVLGVMEFLTTQKEEPDNSLLNMMNAIGSQIGQFIERKLAQELTAQKVEELKTLHLNLEYDFASKTKDSLRLNAQYAATKVLAEASNLTEATPQLLQSICEGLGWQCSLMWEVNEKNNVLDWVDCWHVEDGNFTAFTDMSFNITFARGRGLPGRVWDTGEPLWILDVVKDTNFPRYKVAEIANLHGAFAFPIRLKDKVLGVMEFFSYEVQEPDDALLAMMAAVGSQIGQFIERKHAEEQAALYLKEVEKQYEEVNAQNEEINMQKEELVTTLEAVEKERQKSEDLLLNILPYDTAQELKEKGYADTRHYEKVSILFTDFKGFTLIAAKMSPVEVVENLNYCFSAFDDIVKKYNLEKIKTIGDAYMCAGGLPLADDDNPHRIILAAKEMIKFIQQWKQSKAVEGKDTWDLRLGIHTGPVVAGVVGKDKFAYDIWGDSVNTASRMESSGEASKINISETTYEYVKEHFVCSYRGEVEAKNKGKVKMYFVES